MRKFEEKRAKNEDRNTKTLAGLWVEHGNRIGKLEKIEKEKPKPMLPAAWEVRMDRK